MYIRHVSFAYFLFFVSLSRSKTVLFDFSEHKKWFFPPLFYKAWLLPPKPRFLRRFFCSLQRKYRAALCITKCSYPRLLLSWGSYSVKNSALIFLLSYSLVTHLLLIQRFLTYFSTIPYKTVTSALFLFCLLTLRQAEVLTEKILSIFSIFLLAEGISFHPEISTVPISSQILLQTEILTAKNGLCASPLLLKLKELPAIKANQRFLPQKKVLLSASSCFARSHFPAVFRCHRDDLVVSIASYRLPAFSLCPFTQHGNRDFFIV